MLGAGRTRLVRLLMVESLVLAMAGAMLGIFVAWGGLKALVAAMPPSVIPSQSVIELNAPVLTFTLGVAVLTALICGLVPALQSSRRDLNDPLRDSGKGVSGGFRGRRLRDAVVVMEVALSLTLLIGAGLLMRSFVALREVHLGLQADHVFPAALQLPADRYATAEQVTAFLQPLLARVKALPGVVDAAASTTAPSTAAARARWRSRARRTDSESRTVVSAGQRGIFPGAADRVQGGTALQRGGRQRCAEGRGCERDVRPQVPAQRRSHRAARATHGPRDGRRIRFATPGSRSSAWSATCGTAGCRRRSSRKCGYRPRSRDRCCKF